MITNGEYPMIANTYQELANRTINPDLVGSELLLDGLMGLNGEAGEAIDICKKWLFQGALNVKLGTVMEDNIKKLSERYPEGFTAAQSINRR